MPDQLGRVQPCPVAYCRAPAGHRTLHDIPACLRTCGPIRPGLGREHHPSCLNAPASTPPDNEPS